MPGRLLQRGWMKSSQTTERGPRTKGGAHPLKADTQPTINNYSAFRNESVLKLKVDGMRIHCPPIQLSGVVTGWLNTIEVSLFSVVSIYLADDQSAVVIREIKVVKRVK